jgi:hypothetical protein
MAKAEWEVVRASAYQALSDNSRLIRGFKNKAAAMFTAMLEGKEQPYKRRPPVSLRLICTGDPLAKVVVHPGWSSHHKAVLTDRVYCELLQEEATKAFVRDGEEKKEVDARQFSRQLSMSLEGPSTPSLSRFYYSSVIRDVARIIEVMHDFLDDHRAVFARAHDNCCCCGKKLTDELSHSRGIGPECIKGMLLAKVEDWNSLIGEQPDPEPIPHPVEPEVFGLTP